MFFVKQVESRNTDESAKGFFPPNKDAQIKVKLLTGGSLTSKCLQ